MKIPLGRLNWRISVDEIAVLVEDLDAVVVAVADVEPALGVEGERVRLVEFAGTGAELAPRLDQFAVLGEFEDAVVACAVALGDEDVAVLGDDHVIGLVEVAPARRRRPACRAS